MNYSSDTLLEFLRVEEAKIRKLLIVISSIVLISACNGKMNYYKIHQSNKVLAIYIPTFSNTAFVDYRGRIYDRGLISPQSGESFRPFLNTAKSKSFTESDFYNFQDQIGGFLGGLDDYYEGHYNSLTFLG